MWKMPLELLLKTLMPQLRTLLLKPIMNPLTSSDSNNSTVTPTTSTNISPSCTNEIQKIFLTFKDIKKKFYK